MNGFRTTTLVLFLAAGFTARGEAQTASPDIGFNASAGYRHDTDVNLADLDTSTGQSDTALVFDLGVDGTLPLTSRLTMDFGYSYAGTRYRNLSGFDMGIHHLHGALGYRIAGFDSDLSVDRFAARLDDEPFLEITRVSPSLSRLIGDRLYLRGAWARSEKRYEEHTDRDAVNDAIRADAYLLLDGMQRYLALTVARDNEDALTDSLDYEGSGARLAYGHRLEAGALSVDLKGHVGFDNRDYASLPDADVPPRRDERMRAGLSAAVPLSEHFEIIGEAEYADNASTLASAAYDEMVYTFSLGASF